MTELLPCPFCGAPARDDLLPHHNGPGWVQCSACECDQHMSDTREEAVARWNTRTPSPATWQPIETAPKDGTIILICGFSPDYFVADAKWDGGWGLFSPENDGYTEPCFAASHWMPLPLPPVVGPSQEQN
jgi:hypothetical protein